MSWNTLDPRIRHIAETELTPRQLDVLKLWLAGCGYKRISIMLGISTTTTRDHLEAAKRKLRPHLQPTR